MYVGRYLTSSLALLPKDRMTPRVNNPPKLSPTSTSSLPSLCR